jgi:hypothetical protein
MYICFICRESVTSTISWCQDSRQHFCFGPIAQYFILPYVTNYIHLGQGHSAEEHKKVMTSHMGSVALKLYINLPGNLIFVKNELIGPLLNTFRSHKYHCGIILTLLPRKLSENCNRNLIFHLYFWTLSKEVTIRKRSERCL